MKDWKPMFRNFLQGHNPRSSPRGRQGVTLIFEGEKLKISKWVFHHRFSWSRYFWIYIQPWNWLGKNWDIANWIFWSTSKLGFECHNWPNSKYRNGFFPMSFYWLLESRTSDRFKFGWVELILASFESSSSISGRVGEESQEDSLKFESVWNNVKVQMWILRCFEHEHQVLIKYGKVRCQNLHPCHIG